MEDNENKEEEQKDELDSMDLEEVKELARQMRAKLEEQDKKLKETTQKATEEKKATIKAFLNGSKNEEQDPVAIAMERKFKTR